MDMKRKTRSEMSYTCFLRTCKTFTILFIHTHWSVCVCVCSRVCQCICSDYAITIWFTIALSMHSMHNTIYILTHSMQIFILHSHGAQKQNSIKIYQYNMRIVTRSHPKTTTTTANKYNKLNWLDCSLVHNMQIKTPPRTTTVYKINFRLLKIHKSRSLSLIHTSYSRVAIYVWLINTDANDANA